MHYVHASITYLSANQENYVFLIFSYLCQLDINITLGVMYNFITKINQN